MVDAVAKAGGVRAAAVRRAAMLAGDLAPVARAALTEGEPALAAFAVQLLRPVQPMLAVVGRRSRRALGEAGDSLVEQKLDGARIQVHKAGDEVRVSRERSTRSPTPCRRSLPSCATSPARNLILDGEVIALQRTGAPHPFRSRCAGSGGASTSTHSEPICR